MPRAPWAERRKEQEARLYAEWWQDALKGRTDCWWCGRWFVPPPHKVYQLQRDQLGWVMGACLQRECRWALATAYKRRRFYAAMRMGLKVHDAAVVAVAQNLGERHTAYGEHQRSEKHPDGRNRIGPKGRSNATKAPGGGDGGNVHHQVASVGP